MPPNIPESPQPPQQPQPPTQPQPLPGAPQVSTFPPSPTPDVTPEPQPTSGHHKRLLLILVGSLVLVFLVGLLAMTIFSHPITKHQVTEAQNTADDFNDDVFKATSAISKAEDADSAAAVKSSIDEANSKLDDAQKDMALLQKSDVLRDKDVKASFDALNDKWKPYLVYLRDSAKDTKALMPPLIDFTNKIDAVFKTQPTATTISSYLTQLKQIIDSTSGQLDKINLALPEDKDILNAFKADLNTSSTAVTKAQSDQAAGKQLYVVADDILGILDAQTVFSDKIDSSSQKLNDKVDKLNPGRVYNKFQSSLDDLRSKAKS